MGANLVQSDYSLQDPGNNKNKLLYNLYIYIIYINCVCSIQTHHTPLVKMMSIFYLFVILHNQ